MENLIGSEKQIKWAEDIRGKFIKEIATATKEDCEKTSDYPETFDYEIFKSLVGMILNQTSSKWWIEQIGKPKIDLEDIAMCAEDFEEDGMSDFISAYRIKA